MPIRDILIVGAGPSGLSAAIAAKRRNLDYQVIEQGTLVNSIFHFPPQMVFFTTPELMEIGGLPFVSPYDKPTRAEALMYYRKVVEAFDLQIAMEEKVLAITRETEDGMPVFAVESRSTRGVRRVRHARFVILAIGYYDHPVLLGIPGEDLPHVFHYQQEPHAYYRKRVVVVGGGNSAAEASLELFRAGAQVTLVHRHPELKHTIKYWVRPDIENRIREGSITGRLNTVVTEIRPTSVVVSAADGPPEGERGSGSPEGRDRRVTGERGRGPASSEDEIPAEAVFLLTGYRADSDLMVRAGVELTDRDAPRCDPMTFETNVPGLYVAGGAIAGVDTGTVFIENGRFHGERIVEAIAATITGEQEI
jgi:thioredoxin reductase (NADPH)